MKKTLIIFLLLTFTAATSAQRRQTPTEIQTKFDASSEAKEAFRNFDFTELSVNPNNLTADGIKDLRNNFLAPIKPLLMEKGKEVERLERIAKPILLFHKAAKSQIVVFNHQLPTVFTWKETFVTFSTGAMDILSDDEIAALIAHEMGHLYFAEALGKARNEKNDRLTRIIELKCDLVALTTLTKLKIKPSKLISAVKKLIEGREKLGVGSFEAGSPSVESREEILKFYQRKN